MQKYVTHLRPEILFKYVRVLIQCTCNNNMYIVELKMKKSFYLRASKENKLHVQVEIKENTPLGWNRSGETCRQHLVTYSQPLIWIYMM